MGLWAETKTLKQLFQQYGSYFIYAVVTGSSTTFTTQAKVGDYIRVASEDYLITAIASNTAQRLLQVVLVQL